MGWLWEASGRSILAAVALHTGMNLGVLHAPTRMAGAVAWSLCAVAAGIALWRREAAALKRAPVRTEDGESG
jgi:hypothetical protein